MSKYPVGYAKPPKHTQFKKGKSGNPKGRPKSMRESPELDIAKVLLRPVKVKVNGEVCDMDPQEAAYRSLLSRAIKEGHRPSIGRIIKNLKKFGLLKATGSIVTYGVIHLPTRWASREWYAMLKRHGPPPWPGEDDGCADIDRLRLQKSKTAKERLKRRGL